jgi:hypothetical protein
MTLAAAVLFAVGITSFRDRRFRTIGGSAVLAVSLLSLLGGGSWDRNAHISRELLAYVQAHPAKRFITDYHTLNEMYVLNQVESIPNVVTTDHIRPSQLLDRKAVRLAAADVGQCDEILVNPLNLARTPHFAEFVRLHAGDLRHKSTPQHRMICLLVPPLRDYSWSVRKPAAQVFECLETDPSRLAYSRSEETSRRSP